VSRETSLRTTGAITRTAGKAIIQDDSHADSHSPGKPGPSPTTRAVEMAETMSDISPDSRRPKATGARRRGITQATGAAHARRSAAMLAA